MQQLNLNIWAGKTAFERIQRDGLSPDMISSVFGASGSAKWLAIAGLDRAIFSNWLSQRKREDVITLFGTSIGAFKSAVAARKDPAQAIQNLAHAYANIEFDPKKGPQGIQENTSAMIASLFGVNGEGIAEVLTNKRYCLSFGAVRAHGLANHVDARYQGLSMASGFVKNYIAPTSLRHQFERTIFIDPRSTIKLIATDGFEVNRHDLTPHNFIQALTASGNLPVYMQGIRFEDEPGQLYFDGGLLDYHPVPSAFMPMDDGLCLYPHFYDHIVRRWFDKFAPWRKVKRKDLDNVILISPSQTYVNRLPGRQIPDRQDFIRFKDKQSLRQNNWLSAIDESEALGQTFINMCLSGDIAAHCRLLPA